MFMLLLRRRYSEEDVDASMDRIEVVDFLQTLEVAGGIKVRVLVLHIKVMVLVLRIKVRVLVLRIIGGCWC